ncbi:MAG: hypothetical protein AB7F19_04750 [Candidatus Babeliales bacterium]
MSNKKTIGSNPLMAYLSQEIEPKKNSTAQKTKNDTSDVSPKQRVTIHLSTDLINKVKDAVYWEPGLTLTAFAEDALQKALEKLEKKRGEKYPERTDHNLKGGRPLG